MRAQNRVKEKQIEEWKKAGVVTSDAAAGESSTDSADAMGSVDAMGQTRASTFPLPVVGLKARLRAYIASLPHQLDSFLHPTVSLRIRQ